jgi:O-antigen/teichoic acid export membrane protein
MRRVDGGDAVDMGDWHCQEMRATADRSTIYSFTRRDGAAIMPAMPPTLPARDRNRRILLAAGTGLFQRGAQLGTAVITLPLVLHALGVAGFGVWGAATSLAWLTSILDLGLGAALITAIPRALARTGEAGAAVAASLTGGCALALLVLLPGGALALADPRLLPATPFLIAGLCLAVNIPLSAAANIWFGLQKGHVAGGWDLAQTALALAFLLLGVAAGGGVAALTACVYGAALLATAGSMAHAMLRHPEIRPRRNALTQAIWRGILGSGLQLFAISAIGSLAFVFDNVFALDWLGPAAAAQMAVATRLCVTAAGFIGVATQPLWPAFVAAIAVDDHAWVLRTTLRGTLAITAPVIAGAALLVAYGGPVLHLWLGGHLVITQALLWAMAAWIIIAAIPRVASLLLTAAGILRWQIAAQAVATAAVIACKYLAGRHFGVPGILGATPLIWGILLCPAYGWAAWRWIMRANRFTKRAILEPGQ